MSIQDRLPPMSSLRVFEAAGRHLGFKRAAEELRLTPSAVSYAIQSLEDWLGFPVFVRGSRGLDFTDKGRRYHVAVGEALGLLVAAADALPIRAVRNRVVVTVAPTLGARWLLPNIPSFRERHPDIELVVDTSHRQVAFPFDGIDLAIRMATSPPRRLVSVDLFRERLVPVASPDLLGRDGAPPDPATAPLIVVSTVSCEWAHWAKVTGRPIDPEHNALRFDTVQLATEAAVAGHGIALGRLPLVEAEIDSGRLVALSSPVEATTGYWLVGSRETMQRPPVKAFRRWLLETLTATGLRPQPERDAA